MSSTSVQVAVKVRPLVRHEIEKGCKEIVDTISINEQIVIKNCEKSFTFNYVLGAESPEEELYNRCVAPLMKNIYQGFNVTIFAYGQTGSGKTYSMGTAYTGSGTMGVIPRAVRDLFQHVRDNFSTDFTITVSFIELYREMLYDLLANKPRDQCTLEIREDIAKGIHIPNATEVLVHSVEDVLSILAKGSLGRATASTNMNEQSSRSHSIFTISIDMANKSDAYLSKSSKLHLVDLAGSERSKKTGAEGKTFKEGVDINKGLFVLGNVISALGDEKTQNGYIPYRDSNLTRLLKDSLGGNSVTLMIACISPADYNLEETISTLRYADRARKIKNKPTVNQDPKTAEINELKRQLKLLQLQMAGQGDIIMSSSDIDRLRAENCSLQLKIKELRDQLTIVLVDKTGLHEKLLILQNANEVLNNKLIEIKENYNETLGQISSGVETQDFESVKENLKKLQHIQGQFEMIENDQKKTEGEIRTHEETFTILVHTARTSAESVPKEIREKQDVHTDRQLALHSELQEVSSQLALKEQLAKQLAINSNYIIDRQVIKETEKKIDTLEKEKNELLQQLRDIKVQEISNKIAEQRRKRVQELEEQLKGLKKKNLEQSKMLQIKERNDIKLKQLNNDIVNMKTAKVKLLKQMRLENDRFRTWKQTAERELARVKQQDWKKQTQISKMKVAHERQQNFLKRKFEEAAALNKRLQNTLMKRKEAQSTKFNGKVEKITSWLKEEMEMFVNLAEAEVTLAGLLEDRATLQEQLDELRNSSEPNNAALKSIEEDLELRSFQIQDLQQQLLNADEEKKWKTRFEALQTMVEARHALRSLFDQAAEYNRKEVEAKRELSELAYSYKELREKFELTEREYRRMEERHAVEIANLEKAHHENMGTVLKMGVPSECRLKFTCNEQIRKFNALFLCIAENLDSELATRCKLLSQQVEGQDRIIAELTAKNDQLQQSIKEIQETANSSKVKTQKKSDNASEGESKRINSLRAARADFTLDDSLDLPPDDTEKDPDWRKTPLAKRIIAMTKQRNKGKQSFLTASDETRVTGAIKRSLEGGCTCKSCNTKKCKCKKLGASCSIDCKCSESVCQNRNKSNGSQSLDGNSESSESTVSECDERKKPRYVFCDVQQLIN
uniref:Kinesin motor domain-containing protein n=2 Tax=Dendroctonus ponderosae TaxID=77166 RepID=A0AAR5QK46_DENPD